MEREGEIRMSEHIKERYRKLIRDNKEKYESGLAAFQNISGDILTSLLLHGNGGDNRRICLAALGEAVVQYVEFLTEKEKTTDGGMRLLNDFNNMITRVYMDRFLLKESKGKE